jgi:hypothetical protein
VSSCVLHFPVSVPDARIVLVRLKLGKGRRFTLVVDMTDDGYDGGLTAKNGCHGIGVIKDWSRGLARYGGTKNGCRTRRSIHIDSLFG